mmetsp:Transcript_36257/g.78459  ORF Transcript_36257/g.78459 Transcript_36257/m.78459 type:complete len:246 (+) Transcript_36257:67-804(+)
MNSHTRYGLAVDIHSPTFLVQFAWLIRKAESKGSESNTSLMACDVAFGLKFKTTNLKRSCLCMTMPLETLAKSRPFPRSSWARKFRTRFVFGSKQSTPLKLLRFFEKLLEAGSSHLRGRDSIGGVVGGPIVLVSSFFTNNSNLANFASSSSSGVCSPEGPPPGGRWPPCLVLRAPLFLESGDTRAFSVSIGFVIVVVVGRPSNLSSNWLNNIRSSHASCPPGGGVAGGLDEHGVGVGDLLLCTEV